MGDIIRPRDKRSRQWRLSSARQNNALFNKQAGKNALPGLRLSAICFTYHFRFLHPRVSNR